MSTARSFGPAAEQMKAALEQYSKEELVDLLTHIVKTYVVEGTLPLKPDIGVRTGDEHLAKLSFPELILHLQLRLDHREWSMFSVSGEDVWVATGGQRINLTGPDVSPTTRSTEQPPRATTIPAPTPLPPEPRRAEPPPPSHSEPAPAAPDPSPQPAAEPEPFGEDVEASERFGMLEID